MREGVDYYRESSPIKTNEQPNKLIPKDLHDEGGETEREEVVYRDTPRLKASAHNTIHIFC